MVRKRLKMRRIMLVLGVIIGGLYLTLVGVIYFSQEKMLFHPRGVTPLNQKQYEALEWSHSVDQVQLEGWLVHPGREHLLIYYGGNAEELSYLVDDFSGYEGFSVLLVNYRGYGESQGKPGQEEMFADALSIYDAVEGDYQSVSLVGRSLGSGVASYVASERAVKASVLITPYDSITRVAQDVLPWLPAGLVVKHPFESYRYARSVDSPALFIVAGRDEVIGMERSRALFDEWKGPKQWVERERDRHNTFSVNAKGGNVMVEFLKAQIATQ